MPGVIFFFEENDRDVWSGRRIDLDAWNYACKIPGDINAAYVVNLTSQTLSTLDADMDFQVFNDLEAALIAAQGEKTYLTCPWDVGTQTNLGLFDHNTDWYIFGPAAGWSDPVDGYYLPQQGLGAVHAVHAATATMFHRCWVKNSGS